VVLPTKAPAPLGPAVQPAFFGMHITQPTGHGWPQVPIGSWRIWDNGTTWAELQPNGPNEWSQPALAKLDAAVNTARAHGVQPILVLGQTPRWASSDPSDSQSVYGPGVGHPPRSMAAWSAYVSYLAKRYAGRIRGYEVWNEANFPTFYNGTAAELAKLAIAARDAIKAADPQALVISPSFGVRHPNAPGWVRDFIRAGGGKAVDVWSVHMYPPRFQTPEAMVPLMNDVLGVLRQAGQAGKPIWDTELAYGLASGGEFIRGDRAIGYVARGLIIDAGFGMSRAFWYSWEDHSWGGLYVSSDNLVAPSQPGLALRWVHDLLLGARVSPCQQGSGAIRYVWTCRIRLANGSDALAAWATKGGPVIELPAGTSSVRSLSGSAEAAKPGQSTRLGPIPIIVLGRFG
jgi:hypothetical protein